MLCFRGRGGGKEWINKVHYDLRENIEFEKTSLMALTRREYHVIYDG